VLQRDLFSGSVIMRAPLLGCQSVIGWRSWFDGLHQSDCWAIFGEDLMWFVFDEDGLLSVAPHKETIADGHRVGFREQSPVRRTG